MITVNYVIINPIMRRNSVLKVAREVSANAIEQPNFDHICKVEDVYDQDGDPELSISLGKDESPTKKTR